MNDELFDWDDANILHLAEHDVTPEEAEEVIRRNIGFGLRERTKRRQMDLYWRDLKGRVLQVVITMRGERIQVVTAFKPTMRDEISYLQYRVGQQ